MSKACLDDELVALFLDAAASPAQALAARHHLAACPRCAQLLAAVVREESAAPARAFEEIGIRGRRHGDVLAGRWRLIHWLGAGLTGSVWEAEDIHGLIPRCAVKLITDEGHVRARFRREARLLAELKHPNIVRAYEAFETETEGVLVLENLEGESLAARIARREPTSFEDAVGMLRGIARALVFAHGQGVVHRDLKPSNVFIARTKPRLRVLDLGLAAPTDAWKGGSVTNLTEPGGSVGTPLYMAPEQLFGEAMSERSTPVDLWALGLMAHELIAGTLPFEIGPLGKVFRAVRNAPFEALSARARVPNDLDELVKQWLSFHPSGRGDSRTALDALETIARRRGDSDVW